MPHRGTRHGNGQPQLPFVSQNIATVDYLAAGTFNSASFAAQSAPWEAGLTALSMCRILPSAPIKIVQRRGTVRLLSVTP